MPACSVDNNATSSVSSNVSQSISSQSTQAAQSPEQSAGAILKSSNPSIVNSHAKRVNVININAALNSELPVNAIPTATVTLSYFRKRLHTRVFIDLVSHRSFISPEVVE